MKIKLLIIWISFEGMFRMNLGDMVWYKGKQYRILNGVRTGQWRLSDLDNGNDGWVNRPDCRKVWTFSNMIGSYRFNYNFYMNCWLEVWEKSERLRKSLLTNKTIHEKNSIAKT